MEIQISLPLQDLPLAHLRIIHPPLSNGPVFQNTHLPLELTSPPAGDPAGDDGAVAPVLSFELLHVSGLPVVRLAQILGNAIVAKFFNADDLEIVFTDGIADAVADELSAMLRSELHPADAAMALPEEVSENLEKELCIRIQAAVATSDVPEMLSQEGLRMAASLWNDAPAGRLVSAGMTQSMRRQLAQMFREFIIEQGRAYILPLVRSELTQLAQTPLAESTAALFSEDATALRAFLRKLYLQFMAKHVRPIVESIDVGGMITEKIVQMSAEEVEDLVLTVVRRELRLVVLFGAFVGGLIGIINLFL